MKELLRIFIFPALVLCFLSAKAQNIQYFSPIVQTSNIDQVRSVIHEGPYIYIGGPGFRTGADNFAPGVIKTDTSGKIIWSYTLNMETDVDTVVTSFNVNSLTGGNIMNMFTDSNYVYVYLYQSYSIHKILAIDIKTGNLAWRRHYSENANYLVRDATTTDIVVQYANTYELISKRNGRTTFKKTVPAHTVVSIDKDGSTYFAGLDSVERYNSPTLETQVWKKQVIIQNFFYPKIEALLPQDDGYVYYYGVYGQKSNIFCGRLNKSDGSINWLQQPPEFNYPYNLVTDGPSSITFKDDYVYLSANQATFGGYSGFHALKIKRSDGILVWDKLFDATGKPEPGGASYMGLNSGSVDDHGNFYASGYQHSGDDRTGQWIVVKLGPDGKFVYHAVVKDSSNVEGEDEGTDTYVFNNRVYHIGTFNSGGKLRTYLISTDTSGTYNLLSKKEISLYYQNPATIKSITQLSSSTYLVYKQSELEAILEARKTDDHSLIWSRTIGGRPYTKADRLSVYKDNNHIAVTALAYYRQSGTPIDHLTNADSILLFQFDSSGNTVSFKHFGVRGMTAITSLQLLYANRSSVVYRMSGKDYDGYKYLEMNLGKANEALSDQYAYAYTPTTDSRVTMLPYIKDSTAYAYHGQYFGQTRLFLGTSIYNTTDQYGAAYGPERLIKTNSAYFRSLSAFDSTTVLILGNDAVSGNALIIKYNIQQDTVLWTQTMTPGITLRNTSSTYCMGNKDKALVVLKLDNTTGVPLWEKTLTPSGINQYYVPLDQQVNPYLQQYTVCGYIADSTLPIIRQFPFYVTFDASGKVVQQWTGTPDYIGYNQLNTISINQYGQTLIGGSYYTIASGRAAILITAGDKSSPVDIVTLQACSQGNLTLTANLSGQSYQWQTDKGSGFEDLTDETTASLQLSLPPGVYSYRCMVDGQSNQWFKLEVADQFTPAITIQGDTLLQPGAVATLITNVQSGGSQPSFQWEDSTTQHTWKTIPDAVNSTLLYRPGTMKNKVRCTVVSSLSCTSVNTVRSSAFSVNIDPVTAIDPGPVSDDGIHFYPNPVTTELTIQMQEQWKNAEIFQLNGKSIYTQQLKNQTKVTIPVNHLSAGIYVVVLTRKSGVPVSFKFIKL